MMQKIGAVQRSGHPDPDHDGGEQQRGSTHPRPAPPPTVSSGADDHQPEALGLRQEPPTSSTRPPACARDPNCIRPDPEPECHDAAGHGHERHQEGQSAVALDAQQPSDDEVGARRRGASTPGRGSASSWRPAWRGPAARRGPPVRPVPVPVRVAHGSRPTGAAVRSSRCHDCRPGHSVRRALRGHARPLRMSHHDALDPPGPGGGVVAHQESPGASPAHRPRRQSSRQEERRSPGTRRTSRAPRRRA